MTGSLDAVVGNDDVEHRQKRALRSLSARLGAERASRGWSMRELSLRTGVSIAQLSRIESGERQPSFGTLINLADAFGLTPSDLLADTKRPEPKETPTILAGDSTEMDGFRIAALSRPHSTGFTVVRLQFGPEETKHDYQVHSGTEWLYVTQGSVGLWLAQEGIEQPQTYVLRKGEAAQFSARVPHRLEWSSDPQLAEALLLTLPDAPHLPVLGRSEN